MKATIHLLTLAFIATSTHAHASSCTSVDAAQFRVSSSSLPPEYEVTMTLLDFHSSWSLGTFPYSWSELETWVELNANGASGDGVNVAGCYLFKIDFPATPGHPLASGHFRYPPMPKSAALQLVDVIDDGVYEPVLHDPGRIVTLHHNWDWTAFHAHSGPYSQRGYPGHTISASDFAMLQQKAITYGCATDPVDETENLRCIAIVNAVDPNIPLWKSATHPFKAHTSAATTHFGGSGPSESSASGAAGIRDYCVPESTMRTLGDYGVFYPHSQVELVAFLVHHELLHVGTYSDLPDDENRLGHNYRFPETRPDFMYVADFFAASTPGEVFHGSFYHALVEDYVRGENGAGPWSSFKDCEIEWDANITFGRTSKYAAGTTMNELAAYERSSNLRLKTRTDFGDRRVYASIQEIEPEEEFFVWYQDEADTTTGPYAGKQPKAGNMLVAEDGYCCDSNIYGDCRSGTDVADTWFGPHGDSWERVDCEKCEQLPGVEVERWVEDVAMLYDPNYDYTSSAAERRTLYNPFYILYLTGLPLGATGSFSLPNTKPAFHSTDWVCSAKHARDFLDSGPICSDSSGCTNHFDGVNPLWAWWDNVVLAPTTPEEQFQHGIYIGEAAYWGIGSPELGAITSEERDSGMDGVPWASNTGGYGTLVPAVALPGALDESSPDLDGFFDSTSVGYWRDTSSNQFWDPHGAGDYHVHCYGPSTAPFAGFFSYAAYVYGSSCGAGTPSLSTTYPGSGALQHENGVLFVGYQGPSTSPMGPGGNPTAFPSTSNSYSITLK